MLVYPNFDVSCYLSPFLINVCCRLVHPCGAVGKNKTPAHSTPFIMTVPNGITWSHLAKFEIHTAVNCKEKIRRVDVIEAVESMSEFDLLAGVARILGHPASYPLSAGLEKLVDDIDNCFIKALQTMIWDKPDFMQDVRAIFYIMANWMKVHTGICRTWRCFTTITWFLSLYDLSTQWKKHGYIREVLRCLAPEIQCVILNRSWISTVWKDYITNSYSYICNPDTDHDDHAIVYAKWNSQADEIYIGKANIVRSAHACKHHGGAVARFREHWILTYNPSPSRKKSEGFRRRYVVWRNRAPESTRWVVLLASNTKLAFQYENHFISCISKNLNESERIDGKLVTQGEKKQWPRFRPTRTIEKELAINYRHNFRKTIKSKLASILAIHTYSVVLEIIRKKNDVEKHIFAKMLYMPGFEWLLIIYLAQSHVWIDWKQMWKHR